MAFKSLNHNDDNRHRNAYEIDYANNINKRKSAAMVKSIAYDDDQSTRVDFLPINEKEYDNFEFPIPKLKDEYPAKKFDPKMNSTIEQILLKRLMTNKDHKRKFHAFSQPADYGSARYLTNQTKLNDTIEPWRSLKHMLE